jgi:flavorubredoxin
MGTNKLIFEQAGHKIVMMSHEEEEAKDGYIGTNQYLIIAEEEGILLDPGGRVMFPTILDSVRAHIALDDISYLFLSHQDPDVASSLHEWMSVSHAKVLISKWWVRFVSLFGITDFGRIVAIEDGGMKLELKNGAHLKILPAHYLHSPANLCVYDPVSKILFSGDIGAAIFPDDEGYAEVTDFASHTRFMEGFHRRYMGSAATLRAWVAMVRRLDIEMIAPQHGAIFPRAVAQEFLTWLEGLECGTDLSVDWYKTELV